MCGKLAGNLTPGVGVDKKCGAESKTALNNNYQYLLLMIITSQMRKAIPDVDWVRKVRDSLQI